MFIGEILPGPVIGTVLHVAPLPKDWIVLFCANLPHGVWRVPGSHKTRASVTHRAYITPALSTRRAGRQDQRCNRPCAAAPEP